MAQDYIIDGQTLTDIGNAIREKSGTSDMLAPQAMPDAIRAISGGTVTKEEIVEALGYTPANPADFAPDNNHYMTNLFPDDITVLVDQFCKAGNVCMFTYQINVKTAISGDYGLELAQLPFTSAVRMWLNNGWQFYVDQGTHNIKLNNDKLAAGSYMLSGMYITEDDSPTISDIQAAISAYGLSVQDGKLCVRVERE